MKILLLGKNGQVGWELQRSLAPLGTLVALDRHDTGGDLCQPQAVAERIMQERPQVIVNAAAYTAVDKAESDVALCRTINTTAVQAMAQAAASVGALLVHYSTDYVFNGAGQKPWLETDPTGPLNVYGHTKRDGEQAIAASGCQHLMFRTSWVYGSRGGNFAKTMLRLAQEREQLKVVNDQHGAPTGADLIADVSAHATRATLANPALAGLYHLVAAGETTWHGYASYCIEQARAAGVAIKAPADQVLAVPTSAFPTPAQRPQNSRLSTTKLQQQFGLQLPHWQQGVQRLLQTVL
jgi:dTDP-4-dehydrorhamnose reductase